MRQGLSLRQALNRTLRLGLRAESGASERRPFRTRPWRLGLRPGIAPSKLNELADEPEDAEILRKYAPERRQTCPRARE